MASIPVSYDLQIVDINGDTASVTVNGYTDDAAMVSDVAANVGTIAGLVAACSNGKVIRQRISFLVDEAQLLVGTTPPNEAEYSKVETGARIQFSNAGGSRLSLTVPSPILANFSAAGNANTVNPTSTAMAALIAWIKANINDEAGNPLNLYQGGVRVSHHARRRPNRRV